MGLLLNDKVEPEDIETGTIYVLRSKSNHPFVAQNRELIHKIEVTGGKVENRISGAENHPAYLLVGVKVVSTCKLHNVNRVRLEGLFHRMHAAAQLNLTLEDRFGKLVKPREWFLVPLSMIDDMVKRLMDGSITGMTYDTELACLTVTDNRPA